MKVRRIFNYVVICSFIIIFCVKNTSTQEPAIELPIELVGFPVIILAVRLSNFAKKLAYSLNPRTYASRIKRFAENDDMINMDEAEKRLIAELGEGVCIYTRVCLYHAEKANRSRSQNANINWNDVFGNPPRLSLGNHENSNDKRFPSQFQLNPEKFSKYTGSVHPHTFKNKKIESEENSPKLMAGGYNQMAQNFRKRLPYYRPGYQRYEPQSIISAFQAIANNDQLHCVPRLLCELTAGPSGNNQQSSVLPFNINMDSVISLVTALSGTMSNPLLQFGRAALLGYTSKGNARSCMFAYPECPQDPDKFVEYLNNYNGGFFRYFNGMPQENPHRVQQYLPYPQLSQLLPHSNYLQLQQHPQQYGYQKRTDIAQKRILTQNNYYNEQIRFPSNSLHESELIRSFVFPKRQEDSPESFSFLPKFQNNRYKSPMIFPDRTGTGELRLDPEELKISDSSGLFRDSKELSGNTFKFPLSSNNNNI